MRPGRCFDNPPNRAWEILGESDNPDHQASIGQWLVYAPGQAAFWNYYLVQAVHLRDVVGQSKPAYKKFPAATHEFMILALHPDMEGVRAETFERKIQDCRDKGVGWFLSPTNFAGQFNIPDVSPNITGDPTAKELLDRLVRSIVDKQLPAEPFLSGGDYWTEFLEAQLYLINTKFPMPPLAEGQGQTGGV